MIDIFYTGSKPNLFPHEQAAETLIDAKKLAKTKFFWFIDGNEDLRKFDFEWLPPIWEQHQTHIFPIKSQFREYDVIFSPRVGPQIDHYYPQQYIRNRIKIKEWFVPDGLNEDNIDFGWRPPEYDPPYIYHFGTEFQESIGVTYTVPTATEIKFVDRIPTVDNIDCVVRPADIFFVDMCNASANEQFEILKEKYTCVQKIRFINGWTDTIKRCAARTKSNRFWVVSSENIYTDFNFNWHPSTWQNPMVHIFASQYQEWGDAFLVNKAEFDKQLSWAKDITKFSNLNFTKGQVVQKIPIPVIEYNSGSVVDCIKDYNFVGRWVYFKHTCINETKIPDFLSTFNDKTDLNVHVLSESGSLILAPREIKNTVKTQVYDYPLIEKHPNMYLAEPNMDIVYISNGEPDAERWYDHLVKIAPNKTIHRIQNVNGRAEAYKAAARISSTDWFFAVFAKLEVLPEFDFTWQPDRLQQQKHYIFYARNPVNGLEYGHQGLIAYSKKLVLDTIDIIGLDFTMSKPHEVVPIVSGIAHFNTDPQSTWRTTMREALKLKYQIENNNDDYDSKRRLNEWLSIATGKNAKWSLQGAHDAVDYYNKVDGDYLELLKTFEWHWLDRYYAAKYSL